MRLPLFSLPQSPLLLFRSFRRVCLRIARGFRRRHCIFCVCRRTVSDRCSLPARCRLSEHRHSGAGFAYLSLDLLGMQASVSVYGGSLYSRFALSRAFSRLSCRFCGRCSLPPACSAECNTSVSPHTAFSAHGLLRARLSTADSDGGRAAGDAVARRAASAGPLCALFGFPQSDVTKLHAEYYRNLTIFGFCFLHSTVKIVYNGEKSQSHITWTFQK